MKVVDLKWKMNKMKNASLSEKGDNCDYEKNYLW